MPLIEEYRELRDKQRNKKDESAPKLEEIKKMRLQMKSLAEDIKKKNGSEFPVLPNIVRVSAI